MLKFLCFLCFFILGCQSYDCTKADKDKMFEYIKWCQPNVGTTSCLEQAKEIFCTEIPSKYISDSVQNSVLMF